jgi:hypothetical protein
MDGLLGVAGMIDSDEMDHSRKFHAFSAIDAIDESWSHDIPWILVGFTILSYRLHGLRERDVGGPGGPWGDVPSRGSCWRPCTANGRDLERFVLMLVIKFE